jgi:hypothetical protein
MKRTINPEVTRIGMEVTVIMNWNKVTKEKIVRGDKLSAQHK